MTTPFLQLVPPWTLPLTGRFSDWNAMDGKMAIAWVSGKWMPDVRKFLDGDHWQNGKGWVGPQPAVSESGYADTMAAIETAFTSRNVIAEITDRHKNGVLGCEPRWRFAPRRFMAPGEKPTDQENKDIAQLEEWVTEWWNSKWLMTVLQQAVRNALWAERGPIRLYIPDGLLTRENGIPGVYAKRGDMKAAMAYLWPEAPDPECAAVYIDPSSRREIGIVVTRDAAQTEVVHLSFLNGQTTQPELAIYRILPIGIRSFGPPRGLEYTLNLNGFLPINQIRRRRLITDQIVQAQKSLNLALSMVPRTVVTSGFLERVLLNAQMPGDWVDIQDANGNVIGRKFVPTNPKFGAGTTNYVAPIAIEEESPSGASVTRFANADVKWREPSDPEFAIKAKISHYQDILEEADQMHVLITSDATPSGMSREQARSEYEDSLEETTPDCNRVGRWLLETLVAYAEQICGIPGQYSKLYRAVFECNADTGPLSPDEKRQNVEAADKGYLSKQTAQELNGVEDVDAENSRIMAEGVGNVGQMIQRATALKQMSDAGFPLSYAVKYLGFPEEDQAGIIAEVEKQKAADQAAAMAQAAARGAQQPGGKNGNGSKPPSGSPRGAVSSR